ncbi:MAG: NUDIX domain-containing protein [Candidatus Levyibacteriota bacterium]
MKFEFSAGGIVFRKDDNKTFVLVSKHSEHHGWVFPKGLIGDSIKGEDRKSTALREVKEETGINAKILKSLNPVFYFYIWEGEKIKKTVYYFLMEYLSGDFEERDFEMEEVKWILKENVEKRLTYKSDKKVWQEAKVDL